METVEVVGFLVFTIAAAGLIIAFLYSINFGEIQNTMTSIITPQEDFSNLQKVDYVGLIRKIESCTKEGEFTSESVDCGNLLLTDEGISEEYTAGLNKEFFKTKFLELSFCTDCNLDLPGLIMPNTVVHLAYNQESGQIKLNGLFELPSDMTPPITTLSGCPGGNSSTNTTLTLSCNDNSQGTGCRETKYKIDDGEVRNGNTINLTQKNDSHKYDINYYSIDNNNNTESIKTFSCTLTALPITPDTNPPATAFSGCSSSYISDPTIKDNKTILLICTDANPPGSTNTITGCRDINYRFYTGNTPSEWITVPNSKSISFSIPQTNIDTNYIIEYNSIDNNNNLEPIKTNYCAVRKIYVAPVACFSLGGDGTNMPYKISSCFDLNCIRTKTGDNNYELNNDINCSETLYWNDGNGFLPLPTLSNKSVLNGNNKTIKNLYINPPASYTQVGLFTETKGIIKNLVFENITLKNNSNTSSSKTGSITGQLTSPGKIDNCVLKGNIYDYGYYIGGITGYNTGTITNTSADINFIKNSNSTITRLGGITGQNTGTITNTKIKLNIDKNTGGITSLGGITGYNTGTITNTITDLNIFIGGGANLTYLGGAIGYNNGTIENSYSKGFIKVIPNTTNKAGFIGYNNKYVINTYSAVDLNFVSNGNGFTNNNTNVTNSFWDINLSTIKTSGGGTSKTTSEMKTKSTFTSVDWNEDAWTLCDGSYPSLKWEGINCPESPAPLITISGISASKTLTPQTISTNCNAPEGCQKIEYQIADGAWISNLNTFANNPQVDTNTKITFKTTSNLGSIETITLYSAVAGQSTQNSTLVMKGTSLGGGGTSIIGGGTGYVITNFSAGSNFDGFNSSEVMQGSCEFMLDDSQVWLEGNLNPNGCSMKPLNIKKDDSLEFIIKFRAKDNTGKYIQSPRIKALINTTGGASISLTPLP
jgi:hypothetical protein